MTEQEKAAAYDQLRQRADSMGFASVNDALDRVDEGAGGEPILSAYDDRAARETLSCNFGDSK